MASKIPVSVEITAESKQAQKSINELAKSLSALKSMAGGTAKETSGLSTAGSGLMASMTKANLAAMAITEGLKALKQAFTDSIKEANLFSNAMIGLSSVSAAFGQSQSEARDAAMSLAKDGLMSVTEAADGLKNLLATGFSLDESIKLMNTFKDAAAFNRQGTLEFGQAIVGATQGIKNQNSIMVDNVGITKNLSMILEEAGLSQQDLMRVTSDSSVRQKLYNGLLKEGSVFTGDAARASEALGGKMSTMNTFIKMAEKDIGTALSPAMSQLIDDFMVAGNAIMVVLLPAVKILASTFIGLVTAGELVGNTISGVVATFMAVPEAIRTKSLDPLKSTFKVVGQDYASIMENAGEKISKTWNTSIGDVSRSAVKGLGDASDQISEKAKKLADDLAKENKDYVKDLASMAKSFQENLNDLIYAHMDSTKQIKKDIESLNKDYAKANKKREDNLTDELKSEEESHQSRTDSIKEDIASELATIQENEAKREAFQDDKYLTEINKSKEKLAKLQSDLNKEENSYKEKTKEIKDTYIEETNEAKSQYEEKLNALNQELSVEMALQTKYASDYEALKDTVKEDDISRLKRQFSEEKALRDQDHADKLAELYKKGAEETAVYEAGKQNKSASDTSKAVSSAAATSASTSKSIASAVITTPTVAQSSAQATGNTGLDFSGIKSFVSGITSSVSSALQSAGSWLSNLFHFADGGTVNAPAGTPVLAVLHGQEEVTPSRNSGGNNGVQLVFNVGTLVNTSTERRNFALQMWEEINRVAKSRNKTPEELLGII